MGEWFILGLAARFFNAVILTITKFCVNNLSCDANNFQVVVHIVFLLEKIKPPRDWKSYQSIDDAVLNTFRKQTVDPNSRSARLNSTVSSRNTPYSGDWPFTKLASCAFLRVLCNARGC